MVIASRVTSWPVDAFCDFPFVICCQKSRDAYAQFQGRALFELILELLRSVDVGA
jgi:hypothetical protein